MQARTKIEAHMTDCEKFRDALRGDLKEFREDLKKVNWRMALMLGGLMVLSHGVDWFLGMHK